MLPTGSDRPRLTPGAAVWRSYGALHVVTVATVLTVMLVSVMNALGDRAHRLSECGIGNVLVAGLVVQQMQRVLTETDAFIGGAAGRVDHSPLPAGVRAIEDLPADGSTGAGVTASASPWFEQRVMEGRRVLRAAVTLDADWLARSFDAPRAGSDMTIVLFDDNGRAIAGSGPDAAVAMRRWMDAVGRGSCVCQVTRLARAPLTIIVGRPWSTALRPWYAATGRLALATAMIVCILMALSVRVERIEVREARRLSHLSDSIARLSRQLDAASLFGQVEADAAGLVGRSMRCAVVAPGAGCDGRRFDLRTGDGTVRSVLVVIGRKRRALTAIELLGLEQLVSSASHALDVIRLLEERRAEAETATALHGMALQSRLQTEAMFGAMADAVMAVDRGWRPVFANRAARSLLALEGAGPIDALLWALLPQTVLMQVEPALRQAAAARSETSQQVRWRGDAEDEAAGPERWIVVRGVGHALGMTLSLQDVSRQIETDSRMHQVAKMEAIGQLTGGIAHDFNNLLTVIMGNLELLEIDVGDAAAEASGVSDALRAARGAAELTHQLLAFARKQPLSPKQVDVALLLRELTSLLRSSAGPMVAVSVVVDSVDHHALIDRSQLQNALINLVVNARDAMPDGGTLAIRVADATVGPDDPLLAEGLEAGDYVKIDVVDDGHGVPAGHLAHVFEPFFTTKPAGAGTGLGLAMVYGFARQSRGHAAVSSVVGQGTRITLLLPRGAGGVEVGAGDRRDPAPPPGNGETVLLVEDVALVRQQTARMLRRLRYVVIEAADARGALEAVADGARPDLLLTDLGLPGGVNGHDLALRMRTILPDLPVLFATGFADSALLEGRLIVPDRNLLLKPFTFLELGSRILDVIGKANPVWI